MKRFFAMALCLMALGSSFTGCGCADQNVSTNPGGAITETTRPTTSPMPTATHETTRPTTATTPSTGTESTNSTDSTTGMGDMTQGTSEATTPDTRGRSRMTPR